MCKCIPQDAGKGKGFLLSVSCYWKLNIINKKICFLPCMPTLKERKQFPKADANVKQFLVNCWLLDLFTFLALQDFPVH